MNLFFRKASHIGDILAIPFFIALVVYFHNIEHKTFMEYLLGLFCAVALVLDCIFTGFYLLS